jgi:hypothetical protein
MGIKVNDQVGPNIQTKKGVRQGDPLSPILFNIVVDMIAILIKHAKERDQIKGMVVSSFLSFFISFQEIQKLDGFKSEKLETPFHKLLRFSLLGSSSFWIFQKLIQKIDEKLKQTCPK